MALTIETQPTTLAFTGSPILVELSSTNVAQEDFKFTLDVYIYTGSSKPANPTYSVSKLPNSSISNKTIFNLSKLIDSEIEHKPLGDFSAVQTIIGDDSAKWLEFTAKGTYNGGSDTDVVGNKVYCLGGYTLTADETINGIHGLNNTTLAMNRPDNTTAFNDYDFFVPILRDYHDRIVIGYNNTSTTITVTQDETKSKNRVCYINVTKRLRDNHSWTGDFNYKVSNGTNETPVTNVTSGSESKYSVVPVAYTNRYGLIEVLYMSKKKVRTNTITSVNYKRPHFISSHDIDVSRIAMEVGNTQTKVSYTLNSDFMDETENDMFLDLYRSGYICLYINNKWIQVLIDGKQFTEQTHLNDKLIAHTITFSQGYNDENMLM